jgi:CheY-like chemotaxis protein
MPSQLILFVEDDENDRLLIDRSLRKLGLGLKVQFCESGAKAIGFLQGLPPEEEYRPRLVVLDVKLPGCSGFEVLGWIRNHDFFKQMPVVMFTSSDQASDREAAALLGASDYIVKPAALKDYQSTLRNILDRLSASEIRV